MKASVSFPKWSDRFHDQSREILFGIFWMSEKKRPTRQSFYFQFDILFFLRRRRRRVVVTVFVFFPIRFIFCYFSPSFPSLSSVLLLSKLFSFFLLLLLLLLLLFLLFATILIFYVYVFLKVNWFWFIFLSKQFPVRLLSPPPSLFQFSVCCSCCCQSCVSLHT